MTDGASFENFPGSLIESIHKISQIRLTEPRHRIPHSIRLNPLISFPVYSDWHLPQETCVATSAPVVVDSQTLSSTPWAAFIHHGSSDFPCNTPFLYGNTEEIHRGFPFNHAHFRTPSGGIPIAAAPLVCPKCGDRVDTDFFHQLAALLRSQVPLTGEPDIR